MQNQNECYIKDLITLRPERICTHTQTRLWVKQWEWLIHTGDAVLSTFDKVMAYNLTALSH